MRLSPIFAALVVLAALAMPVTADKVDDLIRDLKFGWSPAVRSSAALALVEIGDARAVDPLIEALKDEEVEVRRRAAWALGEIGDPRAIEPLIDALQDEFHPRLGWAVQGMAAWALGKIGDIRAVDPLIEALKDPHCRLDPFVRHEAAVALGEIGDARAVDPLIEALKDEARSVRSGAAQALGDIYQITSAAVGGQITYLGWPNVLTYNYDERIPTVVSFKNTGTQTHSFYLGYSVQDSTGKWWDAAPYQTEPIRPGDSILVQLYWYPPELVLNGPYKATVALWKNYNSDTNRMEGELDRRTKSEAFWLSSKDQVGKSGIDILYKSNDVSGYDLIISGPKNPVVNEEVEYKILLERNEDRIYWYPYQYYFAYPDDRVNAYPISLYYKKTDKSWRLINPASDFEIGFWQKWFADTVLGVAFVVPGLYDLAKEKLKLEPPIPPLNSPFYNANDYDSFTVVSEIFYDTLFAGGARDGAELEKLARDDGTTPHWGVNLTLPIMFTRPGECDLHFYLIAKSGRSFRAYNIEILVSAMPEWQKSSVLEEMRDAIAADPLIEAFKDEDHLVRTSDHRDLGEIGDARVVDHLIDALKDEDRTVREKAARALGKIGDAKAVDPLARALKDEDDWVRTHAASALGEIGDARAVDPLIDALKDKDPYVRRDAARALGKIGDPRAIDALTRVASWDKKWYVQSYAAEALVKIQTGQ
jgi:HEAT repeat protein